MGNMLEVYKGLYSRLSEALELVRGFMLKRSEPIREDMEPLIVVSLIREKLLHIFSTPQVVEICRRCKGSCCHNLLTRLHWKELFYYVGVNPDFGFPEPDWKFLERRLFVCCLFLSEEGCLLKENRHNRCLLYVCPRLEGVVPDHKISGFSERALFKVILDRYLDHWYRQFVEEEESLASIINSDFFDEDTILRIRQILEKG